MDVGAHLARYEVIRLADLDDLKDVGDLEELGAKVEQGAVGRRRARHLIRWFNRGGDGRWVWGQPGDLSACHAVAVRHMTSERAWKFCNRRHHDATGRWHKPDKK